MSKNSEYNKAYWASNKEKLLAQRRERYKNNPETRAKDKACKLRCIIKQRDFICNYLLEHPCVDCGEEDILVLQFDHVRGKKFKDLSAMVARQTGLEPIKKEIEKCEVVCANCHQRRTLSRLDLCHKRNFLEELKQGTIKTRADVSYAVREE